MSAASSLTLPHCSKKTDVEFICSPFDIGISYVKTQYKYTFATKSWKKLSVVYCSKKNLYLLVMKFGTVSDKERTCTNELIEMGVK